MKRKVKTVPIAGAERLPRKIASLKPHPRQAELFDDMPDGELRLLADSIAEIGLQHPIEILPDGTIIAGHQRVRAARLLGWDAIDVVVRHDLAEAGAVAVEEYLIRDNLDRRQLDPISIARCYVNLRKTAPIARGSGDIRDQLAARFGLSGRSLDRYATVLKAPRTIQSAVSTGRLPLVMATEIAGFPAEEQEQIAVEIASGVDPKTAAREYLRRRPREHRLADAALESLARNLKRGTDDLSGRLGEITPAAIAGSAAILKSAKQMMGELLKRAKPTQGAAKPDKLSGCSELTEF